ncbi:hypothetical protein OH77DRAFT_194443 [Trametes cingulata]|nr:hypothetical protein OH77DRAFT_194443 [Trametes cingulata]
MSSGRKRGEVDVGSSERNKSKAKSHDLPLGALLLRPKSVVTIELPFSLVWAVASIFLSPVASCPTVPVPDLLQFAMPLGCSCTPLVSNVPAQYYR